MKVVRNTNGSYLVNGKGFSATNIAQASVMTQSDALNAVAAAASFGITASVVDAPVDPNIKQNANGISYAVSFVRPKQLRADGSIDTHKLNPSKRRFATHEEAVHHGSRFMAIEKHLGFYVTTTRDPVNAYVNKVTGKTNPEVGKARTNR